jgi:hypothetical protein
MNFSRALSDSGWKDVAAKNKFRDDRLLKLLADHKRVDEAKHDVAIASPDRIVKLAPRLKKTKEVGAAAEAAGCVSELADAADSARRAIRGSKRTSRTTSRPAYRRSSGSST